MAENNYNTHSNDTLYWSPSEIAQLATRLASLGSEIEENIKGAYSAIDQLGVTGAWTGKLFNDLANLMNNHKVFFQTALSTLAVEIPENMDASARQEAEASDAAYGPYTPAFLSNEYEITLTADDGTGILTFTSEIVEEQKTSFFNFLQTAQDNLNLYKSEFDLMSQEGWGLSSATRTQAYPKYTSVVNNTVKTCLEAFSAFTSSFNKNSEAAQQAIQVADTTSATQAENVTDISAVADAVMRGEYGNGEERKQKLRSEGYVYEDVQDEINNRLYGWPKGNG